MHNDSYCPPLKLLLNEENTLKIAVAIVPSRNDRASVWRGAGAACSGIPPTVGAFTSPGDWRSFPEKSRGR